MIGTVLAALASHWRRKPVQLAMLLLGLSLATALWSGVQAINAEARAAYDTAAELLGRDRLDRLVPRSGEQIATETYVRLRRAGWAVSPVIEGWLPGTGLSVIGIDPLTLPAGTDTVAGGQGPGIGDFLAPQGVLLVSPATEARVAKAGLPRLFARPGIPPMTAMGDIALVQRLLGKPGMISHLVVDPAAPQGLVALEDLSPELVRTQPEGNGDLDRLTDSFHLNLTAFGALAFVVGLFIAHAVIGLVFEQRRATLRTLRSLGAPLSVIVTALAIELGVLALVAATAGIALGYGIAAALLPDVAASLRGLYGAAVPGTLTLRAGWIVAALVLTVLGTLAASGAAMWQTARMPILSPALPRAWSRASGRRAKVQGVAGLGLLAATLAMVPAQTGLIGAFGMVAALLVGAALVLPWMVAGVVGIFARRPAGAVTQWFWADTAQQVPGLSLALMALLLALASNVGVGTMVASFRVTFTGWLDQRLASEVYLTTRTPQEARLILQKIAPRVDRVLPILSVDIPLSGQPGSLYGIADDATYRDNWAMLQAMPDVWDRVARGEVVLINEQLGRRAGLTLGDMLDLPSGALPVGGIYSDYGNPRAQALLTLSRFHAAYPDVPRLRFGLRMDPAQAVDLVRDVSTGYGLPQGSVVLQADIKAYSLDVFERTFAVTGALNVLTLGVATVALFASLLTLADLRLPQLAPVWALGLTRRHLSVLEMLRILALAAVTLAVAIPLGLALAWLLLARVNVAAFGWQLPMQVFPGDWVRLAMAAMPAAGLAAAVPVWRLMRLPPAALLRVFAHERG